VITEDVETPVALLAGLVEITVGGVVSAAAAVVNDHTLFEVIALPPVSLTAVVIVAVYDVEASSEEVGVNVAVFPSGLNATVPATFEVPVFKLNVVVETVEL
jgi:hypothetical protein